VRARSKQILAGLLTALFGLVVITIIVVRNGQMFHDLFALNELNLVETAVLMMSLPIVAWVLALIVRRVKS